MDAERLTEIEAIHRLMRRAEVLTGKLQYLVEEMIERPRNHTDEYYENKLKDQSIRHINEIMEVKKQQKRRKR